MYYVEEKKIGYIVYETESLEDARREKEIFGRKFRIVNDSGEEVQ